MISKRKEKEEILKTQAEIYTSLRAFILSFVTVVITRDCIIEFTREWGGGRRPRFGAAKIRKDEKRKAANKREAGVQAAVCTLNINQKIKKRDNISECAGRDLVCVEQKEKQPT